MRYLINTMLSSSNRSTAFVRAVCKHKKYNRNKGKILLSSDVLHERLLCHFISS